MARPRKEIDWAEFDKLCAIQCTAEEIASWFECSVDTIERAVRREHEMGFAEYFTEKAAKGKISLRRQQWQLALKGNVTMIIWLSKNHLGQKDRPDEDGKGMGPATVTAIQFAPEQLPELLRLAREGK